MGQPYQGLVTFAFSLKMDVLEGEVPNLDQRGIGIELEAQVIESSLSVKRQGQFSLNRSLPWKPLQPPSLHALELRRNRIRLVLEADCEAARDSSSRDRCVKTFDPECPIPELQLCAVAIHHFSVRLHSPPP